MEKETDYFKCDSCDTSAHIITKNSWMYDEEIDSDLYVCKCGGKFNTIITEKEFEADYARYLPKSMKIAKQTIGLDLVTVNPSRMKGDCIGYFACNKCGDPVHIISNESSSLVICQQPAPYRTVGICLGAYDVPITKEEFEKNK